MVISIAICDDDKRIINDIERHIRDLQEILSVKADIEGFLSGKDLCNELDKNRFFDLILMDIEMDNGDGISTGQLLRDRYKHDSTLLIYVSSHTKYHGELFDVQPYQFIKKPINIDEFNRKLTAAIRRIESGNEVFRYRKGRDYFQIKKKDIVYLESKGHNIVISLANGSVVEYRGVFKEELEQLTNAFFVLTHVAFVVNIKHVQSFHGTYLIMDGGSNIPISKHRIKQVKYAFLNYKDKKS